MKTRLGFVSNSSTTSFCIVGIYEDEKPLLERYNAEDWDELWENFNDSGLTYEPVPPGDEVIIGVDISEMRGDETKDEFMNRAKDILEKNKFDASDISMIIDGWNDNW